MSRWIKSFEDTMVLRTVSPPISKNYLERLFQKSKNRIEFLKKIGESQKAKISIIDKPPSSYDKNRNKIRLYRGSLRARKRTFLAELCHELGHAKTRKYTFFDLFLIIVFGVTIVRFWLPLAQVLSVPFLMLSYLAFFIYFVGVIRLAKSTAEIRAHIFAAKSLGMDYYFLAKPPSGVKVERTKPTLWRRFFYRIFMPQRLYSRTKWMKILKKYG